MIISVCTGNDVQGSKEAANVTKKRRPVPSPRTPRATGGATFKWDDVDQLRDETVDEEAVDVTGHNDELSEENDQLKGIKY